MGCLHYLGELIFGKKVNGKNFKKDINNSISNSIKDMEFDRENISMELKNKKFEDEKIKNEKIKKEKEEKAIKANKWLQIKDDLYKQYRVSIADDAKVLSQELYGETENLPVFFLTDERVVRQRFIDGGEKAIEEFAKNLAEHAFVGAPITATLLGRIKELNRLKKEGCVIDTEINIDGFSPNGRIEYTLKDIDIDGQKIPARRKFSPRCEMTSTVTEGFHVGPFVSYDNIYFCMKEDMEQMSVDNKGMEDMEDKTKTMKDDIKMETDNICPHGSSKSDYCSLCNGDIIVTQKKKVIGIYLDVTGSMQGRKIENAKIAVERILEKIPSSGNIDIALTVFSTELQNGYRDIIPYGTKFTEDIRKDAIMKVNSINAHGGTPLYDAINKFLDDVWNKGAIDKEKITFPYTYLIVVSDGEENESRLEEMEYRGKKRKEGFFEKLKAYRDAELISEVIPFAYGDNNPELIRDLKYISGRSLINETDPDMILDSLTSTVDSILSGSDNLKMMGIPISSSNVSKQESMASKSKKSMESM